MPTNHRIYDAIIVGARVAGAATAMLLSRAGLRVLVVDRQSRGSDTLSTHALMRGGVQLLSRWGLVPALIAAGTPVVATTTFHYGDDSLSIPIRTDAEVPGLLAPRRTLLDLLLVEAAEAVGAEVRHDTTLRALLFGARGRVEGVVCADADGVVHRFGARLVIGADGIGSAVARHVGARILRRGRHSATSLFRYVAGLENNGYHWHYRGRASAGVIPTNGGETCVFVSLVTPDFDRRGRRDPHGAFADTLSLVAPALAARVGTAAGLRAFRGRPGFLRQAHGPGWVLVGDAGFFRDPLTAHGITDALRDADLLAAAVLADDEDAFRRYECQRDALAVPLLEVTDRIVSFDWTTEELQSQHRELSALMKAESAGIAARDQLPAPATA